MQSKNLKKRRTTNTHFRHNVNTYFVQYIDQSIFYHTSTISAAITVTTAVTITASEWWTKSDNYFIKLNVIWNQYYHFAIVFRNKKQWKFWNEKPLPKYCGLADSAVLKSSDSIDSTWSLCPSSGVSGIISFITALEPSATRQNNNVICNNNKKN